MRVIGQESNSAFQQEAEPLLAANGILIVPTVFDMSSTGSKGVAIRVYITNHSLDIISQRKSISEPPILPLLGYVSSSWGEASHVFPESRNIAFEKDFAPDVPGHFIDRWIKNFSTQVLEEWSFILSHVQKNTSVTVTPSEFQNGFFGITSA
jgi:hypothetical protein